MVLPSEFVHVIESGGFDQFTRFRDLCEKGRDCKNSYISKTFILAFLILRESGCLIMSLLAMTLSSGMPELQGESDLQHIRTALQLNDHISEEEALEHFR